MQKKSKDTPSQSLVPRSKQAKVGRPRDLAARNRIIECTFEELQQLLPRELTVEAIADLSKVGKSTIYRWWGTKYDLALEAFLEKVELPEEPTDREKFLLDRRKLILDFAIALEPEQLDSLLKKLEINTQKIKAKLLCN